MAFCCGSATSPTSTAQWHARNSSAHQSCEHHIETHPKARATDPDTAKSGSRTPTATPSSLPAPTVRPTSPRNTDELHRHQDPDMGLQRRRQPVLDRRVHGTLQVYGK